MREKVTKVNEEHTGKCSKCLKIKMDKNKTLGAKITEVKNGIGITNTQKTRIGKRNRTGTSKVIVAQDSKAIERFK